MRCSAGWRGAGSHSQPHAIWYAAAAATAHGFRVRARACMQVEEWVIRHGEGTPLATAADGYMYEHIFKSKSVCAA